MAKSVTCSRPTLSLVFKGPEEVIDAQSVENIELNQQASSNIFLNNSLDVSW